MTAPWPRARHELREVVDRLRRREEEALRLVAAERDQLDELRLVLDSLGDDSQAERVRHADHGRDDRVVAGVAAEAVDERPVDLHGVDGEALQVRERRVASTE